MDNNNLEETISVIIKTLFIIGIFLLLLIVVYVRFTENHNYKNNLQSENIEIKKAETAINKKKEVVVNKKPENFFNKKINYKEIHQRKIKTIKEKIK